MEQRPETAPDAPLGCRTARQSHSFTFAETLLNGRVLIMAAINFCSIVRGFGVQLWLADRQGLWPEQRSGRLVQQFISVAAVAMVLWAAQFDGVEERTWHVALQRYCSGGPGVNARVSSRRH